MDTLFPYTTLFRSTVQANGWSANSHSVVEVVTDDMLFRVDSLTRALSGQHRNLHVVVHPHFVVTRDITGELVSVKVAEEGVASARDDGSVRESWMHVEIDRVPDGADAAEIENRLVAVLRDVREAVEDWDKMHERVTSIIEALASNPPPPPRAAI